MNLLKIFLLIYTPSKGAFLLIFKRDEAFRYTFGSPLLAKFTITEINDKKVESSPGLAEIIDISPEGLCISSNLIIPDEGSKIVLSVQFKINEAEITLNGEIVWTKELGSKAEYGINLIVDDFEKELIIEELKTYAKNNANQSNLSK